MRRSHVKPVPSGVSGGRSGKVDSREESLSEDASASDNVGDERSRTKLSQDSNGFQLPMAESLREDEEKEEENQRDGNRVPGKSSMNSGMERTGKSLAPVMIPNSFSEKQSVREENDKVQNHVEHTQGETQTDGNLTGEEIFRSTMTKVGVLIDGGRSNGAGLRSGFALKSSLRSTSSIAIELRAALRRPDVVDKFTEGLEAYTGDDDWLMRLLSPLRVSSSSDISMTPNPSLVRVILKVEASQTRIIQMLLERFAAHAVGAIETSVDDDTNDTVFICKRILVSLSWLEFVVDPSSLAKQYLATLTELSNDRSVYFTDMVQAIPEILAESEHSQVAEALEVMLTSSDKTAAILDVLGNLTLCREKTERLIQTVLDLLGSAVKEEVPLIIRFLLGACSSEAVNERTKILSDLRAKLLFLDSSKRNSSKEDVAIASLALREIQRALFLDPRIASAYLSLMNDHIKTGKGLVFLDIWVIVSLLKSTQFTAQAKECLRKMSTTKDGLEVFERAIRGHATVLEGSIPHLLELASAFIRVAPLNKQCVEIRAMGSRLLGWLFLEVDDPSALQEIVLQIIAHCSNASQRDELVAGLTCLDWICSSLSEKGAGVSGLKKLRAFSSYVKSLLHDISSYDLSQARIVFRCVSRVCVIGRNNGDGEEDQEDDDDLRILLRKLLACAEQTRYHVLGVLGTCQFIAALAPSCLSPMSTRNSDAALPKPPVLKAQKDDERLRVPSSRQLQEAISMVDTLMRSSSSGSRFEELALLLEKNRLHPAVEDSLRDTIQHFLEERYMFDSLRATKNTSLQVGLFFTLAGEDSGLKVSIMSLVIEMMSDARRRVSLDNLAPALRLFSAIACPRLINQTSPNSSRGHLPTGAFECGFELPVVPADGEMLSEQDKMILLYSYFYALEYMRESVSSAAVLMSLDPQLATSSNEEEDYARLMTERCAQILECETILGTLIDRYPSVTPPPASTHSPYGTDHTLWATPSAGVRPRIRKAKVSLSNKSEKSGPDGANVPDEDLTSSSSSEDDQDDEEEEEAAPKAKKVKIDSKATKPLKRMKKLSTDVFNAEPPRADAEEETEDLILPIKSMKRAVAMAASSSKEKWTQAFRELDLRVLTVAVSCPDLSFESLDFLLCRSLEQLSACLEGPKGTSKLVRSLDFSKQEALIFVSQKSVCRGLRSLAQLIATSLASVAPSISTNVGAKLKCLSRIVQIQSEVLRVAAANRSSPAAEASGKLLALKLLRGFMTQEEDGLHMTRAKTHAGFDMTRDDATRGDSADLLLDVSQFAFGFWCDQVSLAGILGGSIGEQVRVLELAALLVEINQPSENQDMAVRFGKCLASLMRLDWTAEGSQIVPSKSAERLVELALKYDPEGAVIKSLAEQIRNPTLTGKFPLLSPDTLVIIYTTCLKCLARTANEPKGIASLERLDLVAEVFYRIVMLTRHMEDVKLFKPTLRFGKLFVDGLLKYGGLKILGSEFKSDADLSIKITKSLQNATRQITNLLTHGKTKKDAALLNLAPGMRKTLESLLLAWKSILAENGVKTFQIGNLKAKNADGTDAIIDEVDGDEVEDA